MPIFKITVFERSDSSINGKRHLPLSSRQQIIYWEALNVSEIDAVVVDKVLQASCPTVYFVFSIKEISDYTEIKILELNKETIYNNKGV